MGQFWKYMEVNSSNFGEIIIAGDFNSNAIWDEWDRWWNHSDVVNNLKELDIHSVYHTLRNEKQGEEKTPTFYLQRKKEKPYHIDYFFCSSSILEKVEHLEIGDVDYWLQISDHFPLIIQTTASH
jgi:endonuclease/exonuclease/phosphatase family metal-dependent hydrolase